MLTNATSLLGSSCVQKTAATALRARRPGEITLKRAGGLSLASVLGPAGCHGSLCPKLPAAPVLFAHVFVRCRMEKTSRIGGYGSGSLAFTDLVYKRVDSGSCVAVLAVVRSSDFTRMVTLWARAV